MDTTLLITLFSAIFVNNFILSRFLGLCSFFGVSTKTKPALGMGIAVLSVTIISTIIIWPIEHFVLAPLGLSFLRNVTYILVIAVAVQLLELFIRKKIPSLYQALGIYLPLITTNCVILGLVLINTFQGYSFTTAAVNAIGAGIGYAMALLIMSGIRERLDLADIPPAFKGLPIAFITAFILSLAFLGFSGMIRP